MSSYDPIAEDRRRARRPVLLTPLVAPRAAAQSVLPAPGESGELGRRVPR